MKRTPLERKTPLRRRSEPPRKPRVELICANCGEPFLVPVPDARRGRKYCSQRCMGEAYFSEAFVRQFPTKDSCPTCPICGDFIVWTHGPAPKTCRKRACVGEVQRRRQSGPSNPWYRNGDAARMRVWLAAKAKRCALCGSTWKLEIHHVVYEQHVRREGGDVFDPANGLTLCRRCHGRHHHAADARIPASALPARAVGFARTLLGPERAESYFTRYYG